MLDENVSPTADQPDPWGVGQPLVTLILYHICVVEGTHVDAENWSFKHNMNTIIMASWTICQSDAVLKLSVLRGNTE
eukprot:980018-Pelagomonas_calceolata.AAC.1